MLVVAPRRESLPELPVDDKFDRDPQLPREARHRQAQRLAKPRDFFGKHLISSLNERARKSIAQNRPQTMTSSRLQAFERPYGPPPPKSGGAGTVRAARSVI